MNSTAQATPFHAVSVLQGSARVMAGSRHRLWRLALPLVVALVAVQVVAVVPVEEPGILGLLPYLVPLWLLPPLVVQTLRTVLLADAAPPWRVILWSGRPEAWLLLVLCVMWSPLIASFGALLLAAAGKSWGLAAVGLAGCLLSVVAATRLVVIPALVIAGERTPWRTGWNLTRGVFWPPFLTRMLSGLMVSLVLGLVSAQFTELRALVDSEASSAVEGVIAVAEANLLAAILIWMVMFTTIVSAVIFLRLRDVGEADVP